MQPVPHAYRAGGPTLPGESRFGRGTSKALIAPGSAKHRAGRVWSASHESGAASAADQVAGAAEEQKRTADAGHGPGGGAGHGQPAAALATGSTGWRTERER